MAYEIRYDLWGAAEWHISFSQTVSIFIANLHVIFNDILRKILTIFYAKNVGLFIVDVSFYIDLSQKVSL